MFIQDLHAVQNRINTFFAKKLLELCQLGSLHQAMEYSLMLGGKRIRPYLVYEVGKIFNANLDDLDYAAAAIESVHTFSLIHDDLPAMDDDVLRRGHATCHVKYNEAIAILAGDALQSFGFELLTQSNLSSHQILKQVKSLANATGANGMCLGQDLDLTNINVDNAPQLEQIHYYKTGALIKSAIELGFYASEQYNDTNILYLLQQYADIIGLAFQIKDDVLDVTSNSEILGKSVGIDQANNKTTYTSLLGLQQAKDKLELLLQQATTVLQQINYDTTALKDLAYYIIHRDK